MMHQPACTLTVLAGSMAGGERSNENWSAAGHWCCTDCDNVSRHYECVCGGRGGGVCQYTVVVSAPGRCDSPVDRVGGGDCVVQTAAYVCSPW